jgi:two-component system sensor histidine kinase DesK
LITLDRARASEARLAATQERLRVATDVHDLQGHHLQVIALQLELAERLLPVDQGTGMEQLRAARVSVDEARQGTRDLATRFRSVPLGDELANARDLLTAAGLTVDARIAADADAAPAADLGPVIRETTTNVLRHGGGTRARLVLAKTGEGWRYEIANDLVPGAGDENPGSGLDGIRRRIADAGGGIDVRRDDDEFVVVVTVPAVRGGER